MKKGMTVGIAALMAAGIAGAQSDMDMVGLPPAGAVAEPEVTTEIALLSSYVWRGQVYNNGAVLQPQATISHYDVSFNVWGNYNLAGSDSSGVSDDFSEIDLSLAYNLPFDVSDMAVSVGVIHYTFPNTMADSTTELFVTGTIKTFDDLEVPVIPSVTIYGDIDEANGTYVLFDVHSPYQVSEYLTATARISAGYGNTSYNDYYFPNGAAPTQDAGWNDYNIYGIVDYEIYENVTASFSAVYTMLEGGSIEKAADNVYDDKQKFWAGVNVAYDF